MTSLTTGYCHSGWLLRLLNFGRNIIVIMVIIMMMMMMIIVVFGGGACGGGSVVLVMVLCKVASLFRSVLMAFGFTCSVRTPCLFRYCYDLCETLRRWAGA